MNEFIKIKSATKHKAAVVALLVSAGLPVDDLPKDLKNFCAALFNDEVVGAVGLEIYGHYGLLRSLVVHAEFRNKGLADRLIKKINDLANEAGLREIYLLTETAADYFMRKGFVKIQRDIVPEELSRSTEFCHVCPQSAIVMKKLI